MAEKDIVSREALSRSDVYAEFFNQALFGKDLIKPEDLKAQDRILTDVVRSYHNGGNPEYIELERDLINEAIIRIWNQKILVLLAIENQAYVDYYMILRVLEYDGVAYNKQKKDWQEQRKLIREKIKYCKANGMEEELLELKKTIKTFKPIPIYTLVVNLSGRRWTAPKSLYEMMGFPEDSEIVKPPDYFYRVLDPTDMTIEEIEKYQTDIKPTLAYLSRSGNIKEAADFVEKYQDILLKPDKVFREFNEVMLSRVFGEIVKSINENIKEGDRMEQILYGILDARKQLIAYGREEGREEGIEEGIEIGRELERNDQTLAIRESAKTLLVNGVTPEVIVKALPIPLDEALELQESLKSK